MTSVTQTMLTQKAIDEIAREAAVILKGLGLGHDKSLYNEIAPDACGHESVSDMYFAPYDGGPTITWW